MTPVILLATEPYTAQSIAAVLVDDGFRIIRAENSDQALDAYYSNDHIVLLLLDRSLSGINGFDLCKEIRKTSDIPIILLIEGSNAQDELDSFACGADDIIRKPPLPELLLARVKSVLRRTKTNDMEDIVLPGFEIYYKRHQVILNGKSVRLSPKEFEILYYLVRNRNQVITRYQLFFHVWGGDYVESDRTIDTHIKTLRAKIGQCRKHILTLRMIGYEFIWDEEHS